MKKQILTLGILTLSILTVGSCKKKNNEPMSINSNQEVPCNFSSLSVDTTEMYDFSSNLINSFTQSSRWESNDADISLVSGKGQLTANSSSTSSALEAWKLYKKQMPFNKSWEISVTVNLPTYWNSNGGSEAQVGAGIFVGKPVNSGQSSKVYECNFASVNGGERFVQAQLIPNRLGGDPINVERTVLANSKETVTLKITFCTSDKRLTLYVDNTQVGNGEKINAQGLDNWNISETGLLDVGIMGFAENTVITANQPTLDNFKYIIFN